MITGKTKLLGVIGAPIAHSLSPIIQNAALHAAGLDYVYAALPVRAGALASAVHGLRDAGYMGFNVTIPFKTEIIPLMDDLSEDARRIQAVNTVAIEGGRMIGHNTDAAGFLAGLTERNIAIAGKRAVLIGAGGAARAALWGLLRSGVSSIVIGVRNAAKGAYAAWAREWRSQRILRQTEMCVHSPSTILHFVSLFVLQISLCRQRLSA